MRMWMVEPKILCTKHLLGEHLESHMFVGTLRRGYSMQGYVENNLMEPVSLFQRHEQLVKEMKRRGMNHKSALDEDECIELVSKLEPTQLYAEIDVQKAFEDLIGRCLECKRRYELWLKGDL